MNPIRPVPALVVVYAQDIEKVARFYSETLRRPIIEREPGFVIVGDAGMEVAVVRMSDAVAKGISISAPPRVREETSIKPSFLVEDLDIASRAATAAGGGTKLASAAWQWRGQLHLDGFDPEGNAVQFRARVG